jgi:hypothetical protein
VPPNASTAVGTAIGFLHEPDNRFVYMVESNGLVAVTAAHVHAAAPGVNGPVVFGLNGSNGVYCGVSPRLTAAQVATLLADGCYVNIHTAALPGGEIRSQLARDLGNHFTAALDGGQEVPPTPTPGLGAASLTIQANGTASIVVPFGGLVAPTTAAHIHEAPAGSNGPVVVPLVAGIGQFAATFTPTAAQLVQLRAGNWYVNVHTTTFPGGEIRGQLARATLPTTFGPSCLGSNGVRPEIGARRFPGIGGSVAVDGYGALPGAPAFLLYGLSREAAGGLPLPLGFPTFGLNAPCFFLLDPATSVLTFADVRGCASQTWNVPFAPGLRGLEVYAQWVLFDGPANPAGLVASNGLVLTVQ